jgi:hypothetical protein
MIPLLITGAVSLAGDVVQAWKTHSDNLALSKAVNGADFQQSLNTAATKAVAAAQQQQAAAMPGEIHSVAQQILQSPQMQSMAHASPSASINLQFNSSGALFATQAGGGVRQIAVNPEVQQELQQLNSAMRRSSAGAYSGATQVAGQVGAGHVPVMVNLAAV